MTVKVSIRSLVKVAAVAATGAALASCSGHGSSSVAVTPPPPPPTNPIAAFGANFATDFAASAMSTPVVPAAGDIIPLSLTTDPMALPTTN